MEANKTVRGEIGETNCPACDAPINTTSIGRRRRVQCPRCREVVDLGARKMAVAGSVEPPSTLAALEARIAALEKALAASTPLRPIEIVVQRPERKWKWSARSPAHEAARLPFPLQEIFLHNLGNFDGQTLTIRAAAGSARTHARAADLKEIFERAAWQVEGPIEVEGGGFETGLFLAVGSLPLPPAAAAAYFAMTVSGFTLQSFLDPKLTGTETVLIVA